MGGNSWIFHSKRCLGRLQGISEVNISTKLAITFILLYSPSSYPTRLEYLPLLLPTFPLILLLILSSTKWSDMNSDGNEQEHHGEELRSPICFHQSKAATSGLT